MTLTLLRRRSAVAFFSLAALVAVAGLATPARAADAYVPGNAATTEGASINTTFLGSTGRTMQFGLDSSLLTGLGSTITGLAFRLNGSVSSNSPSGDLDATDLEIRIGTAAVAIGSMTTTFANNISNATLVRDGAYTLADQALTGAGTAPNPFATLFTFDTPYNYTSGTSLVIEIRHTGISGPAVDAFATNADNSAYRAFSGGGFASAGGSAATFPALMLISPSAIPEPSTYAALAGASMLGLALLRRRATRKPQAPTLAG